MKFNIFTLNEDNLQKNEYIKKINLISNELKYDENNFEYLFVFGGDKTFLKALKKFYNENIFIININEGRVGFLSSIDWNNMTINLIKKLYLYEKFSYLKMNNNIISFNEIIIESDHITEMDFFINKILLKNILSSKLMLINNLGSTALARSLRYPMILRNNHQYLLDIIGEPMYHYYKPLNQPILFSEKERLNFALKKKIFFNIKCDGESQRMELGKINIQLKRSKAKVLNLNNMQIFFDKVRKLF